MKFRNYLYKNNSSIYHVFIPSGHADLAIVLAISLFVGLSGPALNSSFANEILAVRYM